MGSTPKPLTIVCTTEAIATSPEMLALAEQGHVVLNLPLPEGTDLVIGPECWRMTPLLMKHLPIAIKGARALRYADKKGTEQPGAKSIRKATGTRKRKAKVQPGDGPASEGQVGSGTEQSTDQSNGG